MQRTSLSLTSSTLTAAEAAGAEDSASSVNSSSNRENVVLPPGSSLTRLVGLNSLLTEAGTVFEAYVWVTMRLDKKLLNQD